MAPNRPMHFERHGRTYQLRITTAEDLEQVLDLDDSLWIAMSAPVAGLNGNRTFLDLVDLDHNGRIRTDEMRAAIRWLLERLADRSGITAGSDLLPMSAVDQSHPDAGELLDTADYILSAVGAEDRAAISLGQVTDFEKHLDSSVINGDGIVPPEATGDMQIQQFIRGLIACYGGQKDLTGRVGIGEADLNRFLQDARAYLDWAACGDLPAGAQSTDVLPLGADTACAYAALQAVRPKLDAFFARCRMVHFWPDAAQKAGISGWEALPADFVSADAIEEALRRAPLAEPNPEGVLSADEDVNPAYAEALKRFCEQVVRPLIGEARRLTEPQWKAIQGEFAPYEAWLAGKKGAAVEALGRDRLGAYLQPPWAQALRDLLADDRLVADKLAIVRKLVKLLLYQKHLLALANNFVSFPDLYHPARRAMFEMGSLVIDGRWFNFAVCVADVKQHKEVARASGMYVIYAELSRAGEADKPVIATAATAGRAGNLAIGKRGIFYDTLKQEYEARVIDIIENPISFREAMAAPFRRLGRLIGGKIEAISGSAQKELEAQVGKVTDQVQTGVQETMRQAPQAAAQPAGAPPAAAASASRRDILLGASFSIAALSSAFAFITKQLSALEHPVYLLYAVLVVVLIVLLPTVVVAAFKLERRDLSAVLEGCGWAINARMRLNRKQRGQFTRQEPYPADATGTPRKRWLLVLLLLVLAGLAVLAAVRLWPAGNRPPVQPVTVQEAPAEQPKAPGP